MLATTNSMYIEHLDWDSSVQVQNYFNIEPWKENKAGFRAYVAYYQQYKKLDLELSVRIRNYSNIGLRDLRDQCWFPSLGGLLPNNIWYSDPELYRNWPLRCWPQAQRTNGGLLANSWQLPICVIKVGSGTACPDPVFSSLHWLQGLMLRSAHSWLLPTFWLKYDSSPMGPEHLT